MCPRLAMGPRDAVDETAVVAIVTTAFSPGASVPPLGPDKSGVVE